MENAVLEVLHFRLRAETASGFVAAFLEGAHFGEGNATARQLCAYLCELTLHEYSLIIAHRPSEIAAAAIRLALHTMGLPKWPLLEPISGHSAEGLQGCVRQMLSVLRKAESNSLQAAREKFSREAHLRVATLTLALEEPA